MPGQSADGAGRGTGRGRCAYIPASTRDHTNLADGDWLIPVPGTGEVSMIATGPLVMTVGHSTRPLDEFLDLLEEYGCRTVVDVRSLPRSRRYPHFHRSALASSLAGRGIVYLHCAPLGGLRRPMPPGESVNRGLRNEGFRDYADHMQTEEFAEAVARLVDLARSDRCAVMCAEAVPWRCHRSPPRRCAGGPWLPRPPSHRQGTRRGAPAPHRGRGHGWKGLVSGGPGPGAARPMMREEPGAWSPVSVSPIVGDSAGGGRRCGARVPSFFRTPSPR